MGHFYMPMPLPRLVLRAALHSLLPLCCYFLALAVSKMAAPTHKRRLYRTFAAAAADGDF